MKTLSHSELIKINGGHNGSAYQAGKAVGEFLHGIVEVINSAQAVKWAVEFL